MITEYKYTFTVYRLPFTGSVTLNLSMFMEVGLFLRDFDAGRNLTVGFKIISHTLGFRTLIMGGGHLPRDCLSFVTGRWKKTNAPGQVMEVKNISFFLQDSRFVEDRRRLLQDYLRRVVNLYVTEDRELRENTSKAVLLQIIPFFA